MWSCVRSSVVVGVNMLLWGAGAFGQATPNAKACGLLPIAELEAHYGAKASRLKGADGSTMSLCSANFGDLRNQASVNVRPPSAADQAMSIEQRLDMLKKVGGKGPFESKALGSAGCFRSQMEMGEKPLPTTTCFQLNGGYLGIAISGDDPKLVSFDAVKALLEKAVAKRR